MFNFTLETFWNNKEEAHGKRLETFIRRASLPRDFFLTLENQ